MTIATLDRPARRSFPFELPLALRLAVRELRGGLKGFGIFIACVALGVMVIAGVGALSDALRNGFERQGETILGGDVTLARVHQRANDTELAWMRKQGALSETATLRTMARLPDGSDQALAELKAVDTAYPLSGEVLLKDGRRLADVLKEGVAVDPILLERLRIGVGSTIRIGNAELPVTAAIQSEPDQVGDRLTFGPRVLVSHAMLDRTGLIQPGSLVRWRYALKLTEGSATAHLLAIRAAIRRDLPEAGFSIADRRDPSPQVTRTLDRLRQFLTMIGLTALLVGGIGVASAVKAFMERRRKSIAILKSVGASGGMIFTVLLAEVMLIAALGVAIGLLGGQLVPLAAGVLVGDALPVTARFDPQVSTIALAALYGFLVALAFSLWPLGRAERLTAAVLFRDEVAPDPRWPKPRVLALLAAVVAVLLALAILTSEARLLALYFCVGLVVVLGSFLMLGIAAERLARQVPRPRHPETALALGRIGAPGGVTRSVVLSLGAGLSLLVAVSLADSSLVREMTTRLPTQSPDYYVLDVSKSDLGPFRDLVEREVPGSVIGSAPMLRGRMVRLKDTPVEDVKAPMEAQWVLTGDRGLSYSEAVPDGSKVIAGDWWPKDYAGEPLVSFEQDLARKLSLKIGDTITVGVLGRNVTARIANLREVKWESLAINFVMVFSPNTLRAAPHNNLLTVRLPRSATLADEGRLAREMGKTFPAITTVRVKDAIQSFGRIFEKIMVAVRVAGGVTILAGALVLAGALATAQRRRIQEAVILKTLGATRRRVLVSHLVEYGALALVTALLAVGFGTLAAWLVLTQIMDLELAFTLRAVLEAVALALGLVVLFGGIGTWRALSAPPVPYLRSE